MKRLSVLLFCLFFVSNAAAQEETRKPLSDEDKQLIETLKADQEFQKVDCWREQLPDARETENRLAAFEAFKLADRQLKIKRTCSSIEGDPIFSYLIIKDGKASVVIDTTQDPFGPKRVFSYQCDKLTLGKFVHDAEAQKMVFEEIAESDVKEQKIVLRCRAEAREIIF